MGYWNYRAIEHVDAAGNVYYAIHEVYYERKKDDSAYGVSESVPILSEDVAGLQWQLEKMLLALKKDVLQMSKIFKKPKGRNPVARVVTKLTPKVKPSKKVYDRKKRTKDAAR